MHRRIIALLFATPCYTGQADLESCSHEPSELKGEVADEVTLLQIGRQVSQPMKSSQQEVSETSNPSGYYWSMRGGDMGTRTSSSHTAPSDFSKGPSAIWTNSLDESVRHSPLIDHDRNIYILTAVRVRKFDSDLKELWSLFLPEVYGNMQASPALYDGALYTTAFNQKSNMTTTFSIDMNNGSILWKSQLPRIRGHDSQGILAYNRTVILPTLHNHPDGSDSLLALSTSDGSFLWEYTTDDVMWNFKPSTPGDGSIIFASSCGAVHRIDWEGKVIWKKERLSESDAAGFCSMGGGAVGPNGVFYVEHGENGDRAHINAYQISNGDHLWHQTLNEFGGQYPAVGYLGNTLVVVAAIGSSLSPDWSGKPLPKKDWLVNDVVTMDAKSGKVLWRFDEEPWPYPGAAGDFGPPLQRRAIESLTDSRREVMCLPDPQGIPLISGDGHVYVSSSHNGDLYAIKDVDGDGIIKASEVSTFSTKQAFLNSPSLAPGMLVAAPCWGPAYVFKDEKL